LLTVENALKGLAPVALEGIWFVNAPTMIDAPVFDGFVCEYGCGSKVSPLNTNSVFAYSTRSKTLEENP
jgi:hypothetical protein